MFRFQKRQPPARMEEPVSRAVPGFAKDQQAFRNELLQKGGKWVILWPCDRSHGSNH